MAEKTISLSVESVLDDAKRILPILQRHSNAICPTYKAPAMAYHPAVTKYIKSMAQTVIENLEGMTLDDERTQMMALGSVSALFVLVQCINDANAEMIEALGSESKEILTDPETLDSLNATTK